MSVTLLLSAFIHGTQYLELLWVNRFRYRVITHNSMTFFPSNINCRNYNCFDCYYKQTHICQSCQISKLECFSKNILQLSAFNKFYKKPHFRCWQCSEYTYGSLKQKLLLNVHVLKEIFSNSFHHGSITFMEA